MLCSLADSHISSTIRLSTVYDLPSLLLEVDCLAPMTPFVTRYQYSSTHDLHLVNLMSGINLEALAENATRFGTRIQETISEHTRDLALTRGSGASYLDTPEEKVRLIRKQLDSNSDREKLDAMKRLIAVRSLSGPRSMMD